MTFLKYIDLQYNGYKSVCDFCGGHAFQLYLNKNEHTCEAVCFCGAQTTIHLESIDPPSKTAKSPMTDDNMNERLHRAIKGDESSH